MQKQHMLIYYQGKFHANINNLMGQSMAKENDGAFFPELENGDREIYQIEKKENCLRIECGTKLEVINAYYDRKAEESILAVNRYIEDGKLHYQTEYLFLDENLHIKKVLVENQGVLPEFILAPDESIWVILVSTTKDCMQIILPLYNRARITKEIFKKETSYTELFHWNGNMYALWGVPADSRAKCGKLVHFQFDKNHLFKDNKSIKLEFCRSPRALVQDTRCFIQNLEKDKGTVQIFSREIDEKGAVLSEWNSEKMDEKDTFAPRLTERTADELVFICNNNADKLYALIFQNDGTLKERRLICSLPEILTGLYVEFEKKPEDGSYLLHLQSGRGFLVIKDFQLTEWIYGAEEQILWNGKDIMEEKFSSFVPLSTPKGNYFIVKKRQFYA